MTISHIHIIRRAPGRPDRTCVTVTVTVTVTVYLCVKKRICARFDSVAVNRTLLNKTVSQSPVRLNIMWKYQERDKGALRGHDHGHGHGIFILATHPEGIWALTAETQS